MDYKTQFTPVLKQIKELVFSERTNDVDWWIYRNPVEKQIPEDLIEYWKVNAVYVNWQTRNQRQRDPNFSGWRYTPERKKVFFFWTNTKICSCKDFMYRRRAKGEKCKHIIHNQKLEDLTWLFGEKGVAMNILEFEPKPDPPPKCEYCNFKAKWLTTDKKKVCDRHRPRKNFKRARCSVYYCNNKAKWVCEDDDKLYCGNHMPMEKVESI